MKNDLYTVTSNTALTKNVYKMTLAGDTSDIASPGQFVNIALDGLYLRRPISVCDCRGDEITIVYKVVGKGTEQMSRLAPGAELDILTGLGNGYDLSRGGDRPLLIGGGVGVPPMYWLCRELISRGAQPTVILGFNSRDEIFFEDEFKAFGARVLVSTADGSYGVKGFVTDAMRYVDGYTFVYTCGPQPMLKAVYDNCLSGGQFSFEERMGCGFGACMGCSCKTKYGSKRICRDGPVLDKEEIIW